MYQCQRCGPVSQQQICRDLLTIVYLISLSQQSIIYTFYIRLVCQWEASISSSFTSSSFITPTPSTSSPPSFQFIRCNKHKISSPPRIRKGFVSGELNYTTRILCYISRTSAERKLWKIAEVLFRISSMTNSLSVVLPKWLVLTYCLVDPQNLLNSQKLCFKDQSLHGNWTCRDTNYKRYVQNTNCRNVLNVCG